MTRLVTARRTRIAALMTLLLLAIVPAADRVARAEPMSEEEIMAAVGPNTVRVGPHHYETTLANGTKLTTHGPDPSDELENHGVGIEPGDPERDPVCATDYYQYVLYGRLSSSSNRYASSVDRIRSSMKRINAVLNEEAQSSGNKTADYKVRCDANNAIVVGSFSASATDYNTIANAAYNAGYNASNADYTIFFDADRSGVCGTANITFDESSGASNANNSGGDYAVVYLSCWDSRTPMHENGHNQGAVQQNAPDSTGTGGHCNDTYDVMCYAPDGGNKNQSEVRRCSDRMHFDCENDTYFDAATESGEWLATHWNIGSTVNRFILFDAPPPPPVITEPSEGATIYGPPVTISGTTTKANATIRVREGANVIATTAADGVGAWTVTTNFTAGAHSVTATAASNAGEGSPSVARSFNVIIDTVPPDPPVILSPTDGGYTTTTPTVSGTTEQSATVTVSVDGTAAGSAPADANGAFAVPITLTGGAHTLTAVARDLGRNDSQPSTPVNVEVDTSAPEVTFDQPNNTIFLNRPVELSGTTSDDHDVAAVRVIIRNILGTVMVEEAATLGARDEFGVRPWSYSPGPFPSGRYIAEVAATDVAGVEGGNSLVIWKLGFN